MKFSGISTPGALSGRRAHPTQTLCRCLAGLIAALVFIHALSCGLFFCVTLPLGRRPYVDLHDLFPESFTFPSNSLFGSGDKPLAPKLIPRVVHQTYRTKHVPSAAWQLMRSWRQHNGNNWQIRFYDDAACLEFVSREFPEYLPAYSSLPKSVERSDFFRYMVILRQGGVYADVDVECKQPLDNIIRSFDTMVVGWESEVSTDAQAYKRHFARKRQVLQWFFAAAPGHPALRDICEHIARNALNKFSNNTNRDTLERTGPGIWTDVILKHAFQHPAAEQDDPWKVRILPRVAFGVHPAGLDGLPPDAKEITVLHHFLGTWKVKGGWYKRKPLHRRALEILSPLVPWRRAQASNLPEEPIRSSGVKHFPVSVGFDPPFSIMVNLIGQGDLQSGSDISSVLSNWGVWQPGLSPSRRPTVVDALIGSLRGKTRYATFVDVGAGIGYFSLAAAARGHRVLAFEVSNKSTHALKSSIEYNGFEHLVKLHAVPLGDSSELICLKPRLQMDGAPIDVNTLRGYGNTTIHQASGASVCSLPIMRRTLTDVLGNDTSVGALRVSANGHEGWIVNGAMPYLIKHQPDVIYLEFAPRLMQRTGFSKPAGILLQLHELGYKDMAHAGHVCDDRWGNITSALRGHGTFTAAAQAALQQPTWCKLRPDQFQMLADYGHEIPENIIMVHQSVTLGLSPTSLPQNGKQATTSSETPRNGTRSSEVGVAP